MGREVNIPWEGGRYAMDRGKNTMGRGSIYHMYGINIPWVGGSIYHG